MSSTNRIIIGSLGNWAGIVLGFIERLMVIPFMLSHWSTSEFGHYLALGAIVSFFTIPGKSFESIIGRESLRLGNLNKDKLTGLYGGGVIISLFIELFVLILGLVILYILNHSFSYFGNRQGDEWIALVALFISRAVVTFPGAVYIQVLSCFGYYHKFVWMGLVGRVLAIFLSVLAVIKGGSPALVIAISLLAPGLFAPFSWILSSAWGKLAGVWKWQPDLVYAGKIWRLSIQNLFVEAVAMLRLDGTRLILAPLAGAASMAAFATMRTGANMALQGLSTITNPLMPELMRFLGNKDQDRSEAAFGTVWIVLVVVMAPSVVILQAFIEPLYSAWTIGKIHFDPALFSILSLSVLVFALAQPAMAVISGNNLLRPQLFRAVLESLIVVAGMWALVPVIGILGGGIALLTAEVVTAVSYRFAAKNWLKNNGLVWPVKSFNIAAASVWIAAVSMALMIMFPGVKVVILMASVCFFIWNVWRYWKSLPEMTVKRARNILNKIPGFNILSLI